MALVHETVFHTAETHPGRPAVICDDSVTTYGDFLRRCGGVSAMLLDAGLAPGDRVLIRLTDKSDFLVASYAAMAAGGVAVPVSDELTTAGLQRALQDVRAGILVTSTADLSGHADLGDRMRCDILFVEPRGGAGGRRRPAGRQPERRRGTGLPARAAGSPADGEAGAAILYTSGMSGAKKGVLLSHRNLMEATRNINDFTGIGTEIREFVMPPLEHSFGFGRARCVLSAGGTIVLASGHMNPYSVVHAVRNHGCNALSGVPSGFAQYIGRLEPLLEEFREKITFVEIGSASMRLDHKLKLLDLFPLAKICMHYGLTEASRSTFIEFRAEQSKLSTIGRPAPNVSVTICDPEGTPLGPAQMGEIVVSGGHVARGYWGRDGLTRDGFVGEDSFRTGDYGYLDEDGYLHFLGRKDEVINMGASKISLLDVEEAIRDAYPDCEICVVGVPDSLGMLGEIPVLCYCSPGGRTITPSELSAALSGRLERSAIPRIVYRVGDLPRTENRKELRRELRKQLIEGTIHGTIR